MRGSSDAARGGQESEAIISELETVASEGQSTTSGKTRILAVDDEGSLRAMLRLCLTVPGCECATAPSAEAASELLQQERFDLMLLDILMPVRSGIDYLPEVVARYPDMAVVMMTAVADVDLAVEAMKLGAYDYITKPFDLEDLRTRVIGNLRVASRSEAVVVDPKRREVYVRGERLEPAMSKKEFDLLSLLDSRRGEAVSREEIAVAVWL
jgi:DNA-binding response OmpR family regulator